jgi:hypothetical protein
VRFFYGKASQKNFSREIFSRGGLPCEAAGALCLKWGKKGEEKTMADTLFWQENDAVFSR